MTRFYLDYDVTPRLKVAIEPIRIGEVRVGTYGVVQVGFYRFCARRLNRRAAEFIHRGKS